MMIPAVPRTGRTELISVLLIEDDQIDEMATLRTVVRDRLPYRMQVARTIAQAREALAAGRFDVILADYQLADGNSFDLMDAFGDQLVIFITGAWDELAAARALRQGVHDYLIKDDERKYLQLLHYRVQSALRHRDTARELRESEARLQAILDHAPASISVRDLSGRLTLWNRHHALQVQLPSPPADPDAPLPGLTDAVESEQTALDAAGNEHTFLTVRFPLPDADGQVQAIGEISVDITARKHAEQQIRQMAFFDPLTGLPNRRLLMDRLKQAFATCARHGSHGAVFFIDLDRFKALNDTLGHDIGDLLLVEVGKRLLTCVRGEDTVARIGGDEFVVMAVSLAPEAVAAAAQAAAVGDKILAAISQPCTLGSHEHTVTPSIGVCLFNGRSGTMDEVIKRADLAMYQAKAAGRGTQRFFDPQMQSALDSRAAIEGDLRRAVGDGQLRLLFQGQVDDGCGTVGAEALLRWQHPQHGLLGPDQFLPLAEQNGLIVPIGEWVIDSACAQIGLWATDPQARHLRVAVNVSARQFRQDDFVDCVARSLRTHHAEPSHLVLELREALVQYNPAQTLARMRALKELGVCFAMDDFGISYSSLQHLRRLPLDQIKISPTLMARLTSDAHDAAIVKTIIGIARDLGLQALAAGVETEAQHDALRGLGCSLWQGYLFGRPAPLAEFEALLLSSRHGPPANGPTMSHEHLLQQPAAAPCHAGEPAAAGLHRHDTRPGRRPAARAGRS